MSSIFGRVKCALGFHVGHAECIRGWMLFKCTRCDSYQHPVSPERTQQITDELLREEGYDGFADTLQQLRDDEECPRG